MTTTIKNLYEDFRDGVFSEDEYLEMKAGYALELDALEEELASIKTEVATYADTYGGSDEMAYAFRKYLGVSELSRELVLTFIRKITCYSNDRFEVEYTFADELEALMDLIEKRGENAA